MAAAPMWVRFRDVPKGDVAEPLGPYTWVELTYSELRAMTEGHDEAQTIAVFDGVWHTDDKTYTDVVIYCGEKED